MNSIMEMEVANQQQDNTSEQEELVAILKRVDCFSHDHEDVLALAAALKLSKYFAH